LGFGQRHFLAGTFAGRLDEESAAMTRRAVLLVLLALLCPGRAGAHIGSPDVFYDGLAGPYPVRITIRMPGVVPGRAEISVQVAGDEAVAVSFAPIASYIAVSNAPPAETALAVPGETNLFIGELWLMTEAAYSIDVRVRGKSGEGAVQIPVNSIATRQLPLPPWLGGALLGLGLILFCGGIAIIAAAAGESMLPPGVLPGTAERRKYWKAVVSTTVIFVLLLIGGRKWWKSEEANFRSRLIEGGWPDLAADLRVKDAQRILGLTLGWDKPRELALDHGKLLHLFLVRQPNHDAFAHIHPVRTGDKTFDVAVPPLPEGDYEVLCDLTLAEGFSSTATNTVHIPAITGQPAAAPPMKPDPDDSWAADAAVAVRDNAGSDTICHLPGGQQVIWKAHPASRAQQDAGLRFEVRDETGQPAVLEPYMGMMSHAAVLRSDGRVFSHLHPSGNYSMAAQMVFDAKMAREGGADGTRKGSSPEAICGPVGSAAMAGMDHAKMGHAMSTITLPYEFPTAGNYRLWVQIKTGGRIMTAIFDTTVL
jgi:hypothetical protein